MIHTRNAEKRKPLQKPQIKTFYIKKRLFKSVDTDKYKKMKNIIFSRDLFGVLKVV